MKLPNHLVNFSEEETTLQILEDDEFLREVEQNRTSPIVGLKVGLSFIDQALNGLLRSRYILLGAHPNVGKTKTLDYCVISACIYALQNNIKVTFFYASLELSKKKKKADWCCTYLNIKYGVTYSSHFVLGYLDNKPTERDMEYIREAYAFVTLILNKFIRLTDTSVSPTQFTEAVLSTYKSLGTVIRDVDPKLQKAGINSLGTFVGFTKNPGVTMPLAFICIDHLSLLEGPNNKAAMDEMSSYMVKLRNHLEISELAVQQFNQEIVKSRRESLTRHGKGKAHDYIFPRQMDFGDSTYTYRDADVVVGLVRPIDFELEEFDSIPCGTPHQNGLGTCLLIAVIMKNRDGPVGAYYPLFLNGAAGVLYDIPQQLDADLTQYISLAKSLYG